MATSQRYLAGAQMLTGSHGEAASLAPCAGAGAISYAEIGRHDVKGPSGEGWHSAPGRTPARADHVFCAACSADADAFIAAYRFAATLSRSSSNRSA